MAHLMSVLTAVTLVNDVLVPWMTPGATTQQHFPLLYKQERRSDSLPAPYPNPLVKKFAIGVPLPDRR